MRKKLLWLAAAALLVTSCYDDSALKTRLDKNESDISSLKEDVKKLQDEVSRINTNIEGLGTIVSALQKNVYVKEVTDVKDNAGKVIGYTIAFTDNSHITIYHGEKGEQGNPGGQGDPGQVPTIGVKEYSGVFYWTVNGEFLRDENGKLVPATGSDGAPGAAGEPGQTPQVRINEDNWEVSYDGETWTVVGPATTTVDGGDAVFSGVKETKSAVVFTLADGTKLSVDKLVEFYIKVDDSKAYEVAEGATTEIPYTLAGVGNGESRVDALASGDWWAEAVAADKTSGVLKVTAGKNGQAKVFFYATNGKGVTDIRSLVFEGGVLSVTAPVTEIPAEGGEVAVPVVTNVDYTVDIEEDARYWLTYAVTKAGEVRNENLVLTAGENTMPASRSAKVDLKDGQGAVIQSFTVKQVTGTYTEPQFEDGSFKSYLLYTKGLDWNENGKIDVSEAERCTDLSLTQTFSSLAGIESLFNLKTFSYTENSGAKLTSIDLSKNKKLESVNISKSYYATSVLESVDLTDLLALKTVQTGGVTALKTLKVGNAPALTSLSAWNTALESLDVTKAPELVSLAVYGTKLTELDVTGNPKLESLSAGVTTLATLDVSKNPALKSLSIDNAAITEMELSGLTELTSFSASATKMETVNLANSPKLTSIQVGSYGTGTSNSLKLVDMRKATKLSTVSLYSTVLEEVIVPKGTSTSSWNWSRTHTDPDTGAITTVTVTEVEVEDGGEPVDDDLTAGIAEPFVKKVILGKFDADGDGAIDAEEAADVTELDFSECGLEDGDLAGLEAFPIKKLNLDGNRLTTVDVLAYPALEWLSVNDNRLTELSIGSSYSALNQNLHLEAARNQITKFTGPSYYAKVVYLDLSGNKLSGTFSMPYPQVLEYIDLSDNALTGLTLTGASKLKEINVSGNNLASVAFSGFSALQKVDVSHNALTAYTFGSGQTALAEVNLAYNKFTSLDISALVNSPALRKIDLTGNEDFALLVIGGGNTLPETLEIVGVEGYGVLNATNPTKELAFNKYGYISGYELGTGAAEADAKVNFATSVKAFKVPAGSTLTITASGNRKALRFFALGAGGTPTVTVSRADGKKVYNHGDNNYCSENPYTVRENESAGKDVTSLVIDGDGDSVLYFFGPTTGTSSGGLVDGDKVILTVGGNAGESVVFVGVNLETYTTDDYGWM